MLTRPIALRRCGHSPRKIAKAHPLRIELLESRAMLSAMPLPSFGDLRGAPPLTRGAVLATTSPTLTSVSITPTAGSTLSGISEQLDAQALDQSGRALSASLRYTWSVSTLPSGAASPAFSVNGSSAAQDPTVTFKTVGIYGFTVVVVDSSGHSATNHVTVTVSPVFTSVRVTAAAGGAITGTTQQFTAQELDQFGNPMRPGSPTYSWSTSSLPTGAAAPKFSAAAAATTVAFAQAGSYGLTAMISDGSKKISGTLSASVAQVISSVVISPVSSPVSGTSLALSAQGFDQFGKVMATPPQYAWSVNTLPSGAANPAFSVNGSSSAANTTVTFKLAGAYGVTVSAAGAIGQPATSRVTLTVSPVFTSVRVTAATSGTITGATQQFTAQELDQFGNPMTPGSPTYGWSTSSLPPGAAAAEVQCCGGDDHRDLHSGGQLRSDGHDRRRQQENQRHTPGERRADVEQNYDQRGANDTCDRQHVSVLNPGGGPVPEPCGDAAQHHVERDKRHNQFRRPVHCAASSGTVTITARSGSVSGTLNVTVKGSGTIQLQDPVLNSLVNSMVAAGPINRTDMIQILDTVAGEGSTVSATDISDLKTILKDASLLNIPGYVQVLAGDIVNGSLANANYQGQSLGNLAAGSSSVVLTELVDKWFLGTDHPDSGGYGTYEVVSGSLFANNTPSYNDVVQGGVGDCYLLSALGAIADSSPAAIRNMFIANGDGTWTVRFYWNGSPDYVTVDDQLPVYYGDLFYAGHGEAYNNPANVLWVPLAEKAYAQWNETFREGRNGVNSYLGLTAGWSGYVSAGPRPHLYRLLLPQLRRRPGIDQWDRQRRGRHHHHRQPRRDQQHHRRSLLHGDRL